jgi:hypothetical protein
MSDSGYTYLRAAVYLLEAEGQSGSGLAERGGHSYVTCLEGLGVSYRVGWHPVGEGMTHFDIAEDQSESITWKACRPRQRRRELRIVAPT